MTIGLRPILLSYVASSELCLHGIIVCIQSNDTPSHIHRLWDFLSDREERSIPATGPSDETTSDGDSDGDVPRRVLEDLFGDREWFWTDEFDDFM